MGGKKSRKNPASRLNLLNLWRYGEESWRRCRPAEPAAWYDQGTDFSMIRILLAEDDDVMREYLARQRQQAPRRNVLEAFQESLAERDELYRSLAK